MSNRADSYSSADREPDLLGYLPSYLSEVRELKTVLLAEQPELRGILGAVKAVGGAGFINYCGEPFLARFEKMLGIFPARGESLDERRQRILIRWNEAPPYTLAALRRKLAAVCGDGNFSVSEDCEHFLLDVGFSVRSNAAVLEIERLLARIVPANMEVRSVNKVSCEVAARGSVVGTVSVSVGFEISSELARHEALEGSVRLGTGASVHYAEV